jgi:hypothetical protein
MSAFRESRHSREKTRQRGFTDAEAAVVHACASETTKRGTTHQVVTSQDIDDMVDMSEGMDRKDFERLSKSGAKVVDGVVVTFGRWDTKDVRRATDGCKNKTRVKGGRALQKRSR